MRKKIISIFSMALLLGSMLPLFSGCTVIVKRPVKPAPRAEVRPARPGPRAVWVQGHWVWRARAGRWVWVPGHWRR